MRPGCALLSGRMRFSDVTTPVARRPVGASRNSPRTNSPKMLDEFEIPPGKPPMTRVRFQVLAFTVALAGVTYLDRVCISRAEGLIRADLGLSPKQMGWVFSAFTIAYAAVRDPDRGLGRPDRPAAGADADRGLVVELHDRDGRVVRLRVDAGRSGSSSAWARRGRSRMRRRSSRDGSPPPSAAPRRGSSSPARTWAAG